MIARLNGVIAVMLLILMPAIPVHADKLTEANMTEKDYKEITNTESSKPGERAIEKPLEIHDLSDANVQGVKDAHGVKVIKGGDWKALSPKDRDKRMRELYKSMTPGTFYMIEVPSGNVWAIPEDDYFKVKKDQTIHRWTYAEEAKLPKAVKRDPLDQQQDRRTNDPGTLRLDFKF
jgi:hypothetical protein